MCFNSHKNLPATGMFDSFTNSSAEFRRCLKDHWVQVEINQMIYDGSEAADASHLEKAWEVN